MGIVDGGMNVKCIPTTIYEEVVMICIYSIVKHVCYAKRYRVGCDSYYHNEIKLICASMNCTVYFVPIGLFNHKMYKISNGMLRRRGVEEG